MSIPYLSLWGPTLPLLLWAGVSAVCGLILVFQVLRLAIWGKGIRRGFAIVPLVISVTAFVHTQQLWTAYLTYACPYPNTIPPDLCLDPRRAALAASQFQTPEWAVLGVTVLFLIVERLMWSGHGSLGHLLRVWFRHSRKQTSVDES